ncbi:MAG: AraC family transcriptional regulator [Ignavibacteriae bacterium]|nr:MAG: AraC family transcriptional regulator [Ignavibacteriota bacterium]
MLLKQPPDKISPEQNCFVHFKTSKYNCPEHITTLTVKFALNGSAHYKTPSGDYILNNNYLIINAGQTCSYQIDSSQKVESISVYFNSDFVNEVLGNLITPEDKIFHPFITKNHQPIHFFERLYSIDNFVMPVVMKMRIASNVSYEDPCWWEEQYYELLTKMLLVHRNIYKEVEKLPPVKLSTKTELYKKIWKAKEFIDSSFKETITLEKIAEAACISRYHFLRLFKEVFSETPYQYISRKRIEYAMNLLSNTNMPVTQICNEVGFDSLSSFSWLYKQKMGFSPETFRTMFRKHTTKLAISKK